MVEDGEIGNVINIQIRFAQPPRALDYNSTNLPGVYNLILPAAVISMIWLLTSWICYKICSAAFSKPKDTRATVAGYIRQKIR